MSAGISARLSPGEQLRGEEGRPLSVMGCLLFKEWDPEDRIYYFWEEWQLSGMDDYDTWVELDHYDGRVHLYEPLRFVEQLDPGSLHPGQILTLTSGTDVYAARVVELGAGVLHEVVGTTSCRLAQGEEMGYAEVELTDAQGATSRITFDSHGYRDLVSYRKRRLGRAEQRRLFGKAIAAPTARPGSGSDQSVNSGIVWVMVMLVIMIVIIAIAHHADGSGSDGSGGGGSGGVVRPVYGGGGGGVGK